MMCSLSSVSNRTDGFDFQQLYTLNEYLKTTCSPKSDVFFPDTSMMTDAVCRKVTNLSTSLWSGWTRYPISDIWTRIVVWKLPLFQLVAQFPRPPLGLGVEAATIAHLLGDPIDSMMSMLITLSLCRSRASRAKAACIACDIRPEHSEYHRTWKALALIMVSYDECGKVEEADAVCDIFKELHANGEPDDDFQNTFEESASSLAADRSTKSLPVFIAEGIFIGGWLIALLKAASSEPTPLNWVNVEAQSIAISALYLWVTSAVVIGSVIGASQSEGSIPRILQGFEYHIASLRGHRARRPSAEVRDRLRWCETSVDRASNGGIYCWRPSKWTGSLKEFDIGSGDLILYAIAALSSVSCSLITGAIISYFVAPRGPSCRHIPESLMFSFWFLSFSIEYSLERWVREKIFWAVFWKDTFFALSNIAIVLTVQWGIMNRCSCWSMWGLTGLHLPQLPEVKMQLMYFIRHTAPWITFMAILFQLLFCAAVAWKYWDAVRVYIQRDDGISNMSWKKREYGAGHELDQNRQ